MDEFQIVPSSVINIAVALFKQSNDLIFSQIDINDGSIYGTRYINKFSSVSTIRQLIEYDRRIYILLEKSSVGILCIYDEASNMFEQ